MMSRYHWTACVGIFCPENPRGEYATVPLGVPRCGAWCRRVCERRYSWLAPEGHKPIISKKVQG
eukprot:9740168-Lingulodinium_polyedra.AAC.1